MPRDLESERDILNNMPELTTSPRRKSHPTLPIGIPEARNHDDEQTSLDADEGLEKSLHWYRKREVAKDGMHPFSSTLTIDDIEECLALENAAFPEEMRASRAKFEHRLRKCSNLTFALYTPYDPSDSTPTSSLLSSAATLPAASPADSTAPSRKKVLLAHVLSTLSTNRTVQDDDMAVPETTHTSTEAESNSLARAQQATDKKPRLGHKSEGRTICLHSLAVLPSLQGKGYGLSILKAYVDRMQSAGAGDRIALLCVEDLVPFYEKAGFQRLGESKATFGGKKWIDMVKDLKSQEEQIEEVAGMHRGRIAGRLVNNWAEENKIGDEGVGNSGKGNEDDECAVVEGEESINQR